MRAHLFLCFLAAYVRWHLEAAWAPLLFRDEAAFEVLTEPTPLQARALALIGVAASSV